MKKLLLLFALSGIFVLKAMAQQEPAPAKISWSEELREPSNAVMTKVLPMGSAGFYALRRKGGGLLVNSNDIFLEYYDAELKLKRAEKINLEYNNKQLDFEDVILLRGQLYLLVSFNNQVQHKNYLFYQKINNRLALSGDLVKIGEIDSRDKYREGAFDVAISRDSSKVLIYSQLPSKKDDPERFSLQVFDDQLKEIWNKNISLPYGDGNFSVEEYRIDDTGNVFLLGVIYTDRARIRRQGKPTYRYTVLSYTQNGAETQEIQIDLQDKFITDLTFRIDKDGNLVCSGFYSERNNYSIKGTYYLRLNAKTKEVMQSNLMPFDFNFLTEYMTDNQRERARNAEESGNVDKSPELLRYNLDELILRSDGGAVLVAEQFFIRERIYRYWDGTLRYDYFYYYNDIIVINIRPDGAIEWTARIPKRQETMNDEGIYSSYAMSIVRDRFYFIYNDNTRNITPDGDKNRRYNLNSRTSVVALTEVRKDGSIQTYPLFLNNDADIVTRPRLCKQTGSRRMLVYGQRGRDYRFAKLEFE